MGVGALVVLTGAMFNVLAPLLATGPLHAGGSGYSVLMALYGLGMVAGFVDERARRLRHRRPAPALAGRHRAVRHRDGGRRARAQPRARARRLHVHRPGREPAGRARDAPDAGDGHRAPARPRLRPQGRAREHRVRARLPRRRRAAQPRRRARGVRRRRPGDGGAGGGRRRRVPDAPGRRAAGPAGRQPALETGE